MRKLVLSLLILFVASQSFAQERQIYGRLEVLAEGVYDSTKVTKHSYKIYYNQEADSLFRKVLMWDKKLQKSGFFGRYIAQDNGEPVYKMEEWVDEYCPELNYVIKSGGHGYASAYDLKTLKETLVNPSTYVYSPSGKYRFGTFEDDGMKYYLEIKENGTYVPHLIHYGLKDDMVGVYWADDDTIYYLKEEERLDGSKYWSAYSTKYDYQSPENTNE